MLIYSHNKLDITKIWVGHSVNALASGVSLKSTLLVCIKMPRLAGDMEMSEPVVLIGHLPYTNVQWIN